MNLGGIIAIAAIGTALIVGVLLIFYFTVFQNMKLKKFVRNCQSRFEKSHAMLFGQDSQYIKRLETISSMNLTYVQDYSEWNRKFKDIRDVLDANAQANINSMQDLIVEKRFADLKAAIPTCKKSVDDYEKAVDDLDRSLRHKFQDEETCRQLACEQRERFRKVKQEYYAKQADLSLVSSSFEAIFHKIDSLLINVDTDIENAQYIDAKTILANNIAPITESLGHILKNLPNMCISVVTILPEKLMRLSHRYDELINEGYPLHHILVKGDITAIDDRLSKIAVRIQGLNLKGIDSALDDITHQIDDFMKQFDKEVTARKSFENECDDIVKEETVLESTFINLCHALPALKNIYLLGDIEQGQINSIQDSINKAGASKRTLDNYMNSMTHQPYSILVEKMNNLHDRNKEASSAIQSLQDSLTSLKTDSEKAREDLSTYYKELKKSEIIVRKTNIPAISSRFQSDFLSLHETVDALHEVLFVTPIDVKKVRKLHATLKKLGDKTFAGVTKATSDLAIAEKEIVKANRKRKMNGEINSLLSQAEGLLLSGDFRQAYETTLSAERVMKDFNE